MFSRENWLKWLLYTFISIGLLFVGSISSWSQLYIDPLFKSEMLSNFKTRFIDFKDLITTNDTFSSTLITVIFWSAMGALIYMLLWALYSLVHGLFYEIELSLIFVHPKSFRESQHWSAAFSRILLKIASGVVLIGYSVLFIQIVYPALLDQFIFGLLYFTPKSLLVDLFGSVIMMSVGLIIFSFLLQTTFLRRKEA